MATATVKKTSGRPKISLDNENSVVVSIRVPKSWLEAFDALETEEVKRQTLMRQALRRYLHSRKAFGK
jgi:metal-responsive CopG/Arc/MetJ family transcriptional regulator